MWISIKKTGFEKSVVRVRSPCRFFYIYILWNSLAVHMAVEYFLVHRKYIFRPLLVRCVGDISSIYIALLCWSSLVDGDQRHDRPRTSQATARSKSRYHQNWQLCINLWTPRLPKIWILKNLTEPIGRYGNPDMHFLGTLKIEFQILKVFSFLMCDKRSVFYVSRAPITFQMAFLH